MKNVHSLSQEFLWMEEILFLFLLIQMIISHGRF